MRVLHEIEQRAAEHQIELIENDAYRRDGSLIENGPAHARPSENADVKAYGGEDEERAELRQESQYETAIKAHLDLRREIPEDQARHDGSRNATQGDCLRYDFGERRKQITAAFLDLIHRCNDVRLGKCQYAAGIDVDPVGFLDRADRHGSAAPHDIVEHFPGAAEQRSIVSGFAGLRLQRRDLRVDFAFQLEEQT